MSCPADFDAGLGSSCLFRCPYDFKYVQPSGGVGGRCVHNTNNDLYVSLNALPKIQPNAAEPPAYTRERQRVGTEINNIRTQVQTLEAERANFASAQAENTPFSGKIAGAQAEFRGYESVKSAAKEVKQISDSIVRPRQPVAPRKDIGDERRAILALSEKRVQLLQVALMTVLVCMVAYIVLPASVAHGVAFLIACGGVAVGIFLTTT